MDFKTYWFGLSLTERAAFADRVDRSAGYLQLVAGGFRKASHTLASMIEDQTSGAVSKRELRPDIFGAPKRGDASGRTAVP